MGGEMSKSKIEWTDRTWEPVQGCTKVSDGCRNCYAERLAKGRMKRFYPEGFGKVILREDKLDQPLHWRKPSKIFVCSRSDLFHPDVPEKFIDRVFFVMTNPFSNVQIHTFQILTKRPERILNGTWLPEWKHIWLGVSVEDQKTADERIPILLQIPAAVRFVSYEPALGPVDIESYLIPKGHCLNCGREAINIHHGEHWVGPDFEPNAWEPCGPVSKGGIDGIIMGGESGPGARPMKLEWARNVKNQCEVAGVPLFIKQLHINGRISHNMEKWPADLRVRELPEVMG